MLYRSWQLCCSANKAFIFSARKVLSGTAKGAISMNWISSLESWHIQEFAITGWGDGPAGKCLQCKHTEMHSHLQHVGKNPGIVATVVRS